MNRKAPAVVWFAMLLFSLVSCGESAPTTAVPATNTPIPTMTTEDLTIFAPEGGKLVFQGIEIFTSGLPYEINVMEGVATDLVIEGLYNGTFDLVFMHRRPRPDEAIGFFELVRSNVAIITHPDIVVDDLTPAEIAAIFSGEITNWSEVGAQDQEIVLFILPETDSVTEALRAGIFGDQPFAASARRFPSETSVVLSAMNVPGAVGYASWATKKYLELIDSTKKDDDFNVVSIDGIAIDDPAYPMAIEIGFGYLPGRQDFLQPLFDWFTTFLTTTAGKQLLSLFDVSPVNGE